MSSDLTSQAICVPPAILIRRFTVDEYRQLGVLGVLTEDHRVELLDGFISPKTRHSPIHDATLCIVEQLIRDRLVAAWFLRIQCAVTTLSSAPEPDLAVVLGPASRYLAKHPVGEEIRLVVEVAETSVARDRVKAEIYASANIPEYWLLNLPEKQLERYQQPISGKYQTLDVLHAEEDIALRLGESNCLPIAVDEMLPGSGK